jgi:hypothetical protein
MSPCCLNCGVYFDEDDPKSMSDLDDDCPDDQRYSPDCFCSRKCEDAFADYLEVEPAAG